MNAEKYAKQLIRMSPDPARALDQFLDYLLDTFEVENLERHKFNFEAAMTVPTKMYSIRREYPRRGTH